MKKRLTFELINVIIIRNRTVRFEKLILHGGTVIF